MAQIKIATICSFHFSNCHMETEVTFPFNFCPNSQLTGLSLSEMSSLSAFKEDLGDINDLSRLHRDEEQEWFADYAGPEEGFVKDFGYINLFPFLAGMLDPNSAVTERYLDLIANRSLLWTDYGLRSLSPSSYHYGKPSSNHDAPYWRGSIWMNVNFLCLTELDRVANSGASIAERAASIRDGLRGNLMRTVGWNLAQRGYLYEHYDDVSGHGMGTRPFAGWTSLIALALNSGGTFPHG